uniref:Oxidation resistance protein 1 n=1 Tax=Emiliania huxleyi TaxID=2903 RepID=A0A6V2NHM8_EMIHU
MDLLRALFGSRCSLSEPPTLSPGDDPPPPLPPLLTLPADALVHLCTSLSVEDLSRLSLVIGGLPDEVWRHSLRSWIARVDRFGCDSGDDLEAWLEEAAAALVVSGGAGDRPLRALVNRLRPLLCAVCDEGEASQVFFAASRRGACERCASERPLELERWRRAQCVREARALALQDEASRAELEAALRDVLPLPAGGSRLLFSSDRHGGSATALLRAARDEPCSVVLVTERPRASSAAAAERRAFGAFVATAWPRAAGEGRRWFGDVRCCLFGIAPRVVVHAATRADEHYCLVSRQGIGFGGDVDGGHALSLSPDLSVGRCLPSRTYGDTSRLASGVDFVAERVQLWGVAEEPAAKARASRRAAWEAGGDGVLEGAALKPGADKLMLEFVGIERDVALLRRYNG